MDGIKRATDVMVAGKVAVVAGLVYTVFVPITAQKRIVKLKAEEIERIELII